MNVDYSLGMRFFRCLVFLLIICESLLRIYGSLLLFHVKATERKNWSMEHSIITHFKPYTSGYKIMVFAITRIDLSIDIFHNRIQQYSYHISHKRPITAIRLPYI